jgi:hypothetical protein
VSQDHWTKHPLVAILGLIASVIAIVVFVTGRAKLSDFISALSTGQHSTSEPATPDSSAPTGSENVDRALTEPVRIEPEVSTAQEISQRIGLISGTCLSIEGPLLPKGARVFAVTLDPPHRVLWSEVLGQRTSGCESGLAASYRAYSISTDGWGMTYVDTAVGLVGFRAPPTLTDGSLSVRFSDDPGIVTFRNCSSSEGFHITAWRNGKRIWHVYTWVPYDTPNTCTPEEVE